jgi:hypothetical protein
VRVVRCCQLSLHRSSSCTPGDRQPNRAKEKGSQHAGALDFAYAPPVTIDEIEAIVADVHRVERWLGLAGLLGLAARLVVGVRRWTRCLGSERLEGEQGEGPAPYP